MNRDRVTTIDAVSNMGPIFSEHHQIGKLWLNLRFSLCAKRRNPIQYNQDR
jgi:hypothetical protein